MTLYDITGEFLDLYDMATDEDDQAFLDTLEGLKGELEIKAGGYVHVINQLAMEVAECDKIIEAFKDKKEKRKKAVKRMKDALMEAMDIAGFDSLPAGEYTLKIAKNGGQQPLKIDGEVPDNYKKIIYEDDKELIRKALNDGEELEFAHLEPRGRHIVIK